MTVGEQHTITFSQTVSAMLTRTTGAMQFNAIKHGVCRSTSTMKHTRSSRGTAFAGITDEGNIRRTSGDCGT